MILLIVVNRFCKANRNYDYSDFHAILALRHKRLEESLLLGLRTRGSVNYCIVYCL